MVGLDNLLAKPLEQSLARRQQAQGELYPSLHSPVLSASSPPVHPQLSLCRAGSQGRKWELVCDPLDPRGGRELGTETPWSCVVHLFVQGLAHGEGYTSVFLE